MKYDLVAGFKPITTTETILYTTAAITVAVALIIALFFIAKILTKDLPESLKSHKNRIWMLKRLVIFVGLIVLIGAVRFVYYNL